MQKKQLSVALRSGTNLNKTLDTNRAKNDKTQFIFPHGTEGEGSKHLSKSSCSSSQTTFAEILTLWQQENEIKLKGATKNKYSYLIAAHILPSLGHIRISEITTSLINEFIHNKLQSGRLNNGGGLSANYVRGMAFIISSAIEYAASKDICLPLKNKIHIPNTAKKQLSILTYEEQSLIEQQIYKKLSSVNIGIMISLYTGLRIGEVCALSWDDIDFHSCTIYVRHTVSRVKATSLQRKTELILDEPKTLSSKRIIPIPSPLMKLLIVYRDTSRSHFVISDKDSFVSPRTYEARFHKVLSDLHIKNLNYHVLRHTFATRCIEVGVDTKSLSEILGHSNISITLNTYVHPSLMTKKKQLEKLSLLSPQDYEI